MGEYVRNMLKWISISCLMLAAFFLRPMALGEAFAPLALIFALIAIVSFIASGLKIDLSLLLRRNLSIAACTVLIWIYLTIHALLSGAKNPNFLFTALITFASVMCAYSVILSDKENNRKFFIFLRVMLLLFIASYFITLLLSLFIPLETMHLFDIRTSNNVDYNDKWGGVYFPLTPAYGITKIFGMTFFRSSGPFREAGIFQAFIVWAFYSISNSRKKSLCLKILLLLGLFASYSTAGIAIFGLTAVINVLFNINSTLNWIDIFKKITAMILVFILLAILFLYMPIFGLIDKMDKSQASVNDRIEATYNGLSLLVDNPLGIGFFNSSDPSIGVNFISATGLIGFPGIILFATLVFISVFFMHSRVQYKIYIIFMLPFFFTALFSQPFIDAPLIYVMLFQNSNGDI